MSSFQSFSQNKRQKEEKEKNKILVKNLNKRMFRGFNKIKKLKDIKEFGLNKIHKILTPTNKWEEYEPFPFEDIYNVTYKDRFLKTLNNEKIKAFDVVHIGSNSNNIKTNKNKKDIFLTGNNKTRNKTQGEIFDEINKKQENEKKILQKIFPDKDEMNVITSVPFFSLIKNPNKTYYINNKHNNNKEKNLQEKQILEEEFLYKLSHKYQEDKNNINYNKGLVKGFRTAYNEFGEKSNSKHIPKKLELNIENMLNNEKIPQLSPVERHLQKIENNLNLIRTLPNEMFKEFENNFLNYPYENEHNNLNKTENTNKEEEKIIKLDSNIFEEKKNKLLEKQFSKTFYNPNITPKFPIGDYLNQQIKNKTEKFDKLHKLAFEEHIKRKSSNLNIPKFKNKNIVEISPNSHLFFRKKPTYKSLYDIESKTRDILIASKLKNEYCTQDINRILRGYRPWIEEDIQ